MGETILLIITALISGLVATVVTIWWQEKSQKQKEKTKIFEILMAKRYDIPSEESVEALNKIDVVFYNSENVRKAWKEFCDTTDAPDIAQKPQLISDKHLKLLEEIAKDIGYKKIQWDNIKSYYFPTGLSDRKQDEAILRRVQIDAALAQIKNLDNEKNNAQVNKNDEMASKIFMEAIKNPDGMINLMKVIEQAQKLTK